MMKELIVDLGERSYPIRIGAGILNDVCNHLENVGVHTKHKLFIITDSHVAPLYLEQVTQLLRTGGYTVHSATVDAGEKSKSFVVLESLITEALKAGLDRNSVVLALGGGVIGDLAGFVAASFMRGVRFVQLPTTILAHDSSVGGKVGINHSLAKNIIGAFHQPELVLYDISLLKSLPIREIRAGLSEVIKHGFIWDTSFVHWAEANTEYLLALEDEAISYALYNGCSVKANVVSRDERENDLRAILNLGHTIGHALEAVAGYDELLHGEAIAIGMVGAAKLAIHLGYSADILDTYERIFCKLALPTRIPQHFDAEAIMSAMMHDKKFKDGKMVFIIPISLGSVEINRDVSVELVRSVVSQLKEEEVRTW
jgi:3-dehydroquinate synthase